MNVISYWVVIIVIEFRLLCFNSHWNGKAEMRIQRYLFCNNVLRRGSVQVCTDRPVGAGSNSYSETTIAETSYNSAYPVIFSQYLFQHYNSSWNTVKAQSMQFKVWFSYCIRS